MRDPAPPEYQPIFRVPAVVIWMLGSFVLVFGIMSFLPPQTLDGAIGFLAFIPAQFSAIDLNLADLSVRSLLQVSPLVTYAFLHGDLVHLLVNSLGFLAFATPVARRLGNGAFLVFCLVTCVLSALAYWGLHVGSQLPMVGASGILSGLVGGAVRFMFLDPRGQWGREGGMLPLTHPQVISFSLVWLVANFILGVWGIGTTSDAQSIAWEAHMGGYIAGLVLFPLFDWRKPSRSPGLFAYEDIS